MTNEERYDAMRDEIIDLKNIINRQQAIVEKSEKVEYIADKTIATLQAENERLEVENQSLRGAANSLKMHYEEAHAEIERYKGVIKILEKDVAAAKSEAVKEFAMKLKCGVPQETGVIRCSDIDNLVKETVGENNE